MCRDRSRRTQLTERTLHHFLIQLGSSSWNLDGLQTLCDIQFLRKLADIHTSGWDDVRELLDAKTQKMVRFHASCCDVPISTTFLLQLAETDSMMDLQGSAADYLARTQILFAPLLPQLAPQSESSPPASDKFGSLLPYGTPAVEQQFQPAIELAKPSPRFGLLLVNSSFTR